jgi:hypothetical protein
MAGAKCEEVGWGVYKYSLLSSSRFCYDPVIVCQSFFFELLMLLFAALFTV